MPCCTASGIIRSAWCRISCIAVCGLSSPWKSLAICVARSCTRLYPGAGLGCSTSTRRPRARSRCGQEPTARGWRRPCPACLRRCRAPARGAPAAGRAGWAPGAAKRARRRAAGDRAGLRRSSAGRGLALLRHLSRLGRRRHRLSVHLLDRLLSVHHRCPRARWECHRSSLLLGWRDRVGRV